MCYVSKDKKYILYEYLTQLFLQKEKKMDPDICN